jgi:arylsulfatase A-like enzyme
MHDLFPTLLALAGTAPPRGVAIEAVPLPGAGLGAGGRGAGEPIVGEFAGPPLEFLNVMRERFPGADLSRFDRTLVALRRDGYTIHWGSDGRHALYSESDDPEEEHDLQESDPARLRQMTDAVEAWLRRPARGAAPRDTRSGF